MTEAATEFASVFTRKGRKTRMFQTPPTMDKPRRSRRLLPLLSGVLVVAVLAGALVFSINFRSGAHAASVVSTRCATRQSDETFTDGLPTMDTLFWVKMKTTWCWNGITVTSHSTILYWGVTTLGKIYGYSSLYNPAYRFNCYVASGSRRNCSGNHEWMQEDFVGTPPRDCYLSIDQEENYKGQFFAQGHKRCIPF
jgi:hypothetical protein